VDEIGSVAFMREIKIAYIVLIRRPEGWECVGLIHLIQNRDSGWLM